MLIMSLLVLVSCGAKKTATTLRISSGMALSNNSYAGGLVFYGRSSTGQFFSAPVGYNGASANNQVEIVLDKGIWSFSAIGWSGTNGGATGELIGSSKCALVAGVNIDSNEQTVNLNLSTTDCSLAEFGGNLAAGTIFKKIQLITCGTLYTNTATEAVLSADYVTYCTNNANVAPDFKVYAKSAQISVPVLIPGQAATNNSPLSFCLDLTNGQIGNAAQSVPAKGLPLAVELFENTCADSVKKPMAKYDLLEGMDYTYSGFDHRYYTVTGNSNIYLLASVSRRGTSSLMSSLPSFKCHATDPCIKYPTSSYQRRVRPGRPVYIKEAGTDSCADLNPSTDVIISDNTPTPANITGFDVSADCSMNNGKIFVNLQPSYLSAASCSTPPCTLELTFSSGTTSLTFEVEDPLAGIASVEAYDFIFRSVGHEDIISTPLTGTSLNAYNSMNESRDHGEGGEDRHFGILSKIREMFRPDAVGGLLASYTTATSLNGSNMNVAVWDKGDQKSYNIKVEADATTVPQYIFDDADAASVASSNRTFSHKMTISRIVGGALIPEQIIRFDYATQVGMSESKNIDIDTTKDELRTGRELLFWNTSVVDRGRFETYGLETIVKNSNQANILSQRTYFTRAEREPTASLKMARIDEFSFESKKDLATGNYNEYGHKQSIMLANGVAVYQQSSAGYGQASASLDYFSSPVLKKYNQSSGVNNNTSFARSPDGTKQVWAWAEFNGTNWDMKVVTKSSGSVRVIHSFTISSDSSFTPKLSINNGGQVGLAWVKQVTTPTYYVYAAIWDGTNWKDTANNSITGSPYAPSASLYSYGTGPLSVDIVDASPSSSASDKAVVLSKFGSGWELHYAKWVNATPAWSTLTYLTTATALPLDISLLKADATNYYVAWVYASSPYSIKALTTANFTTPSVSSAQNISASNPKLFTYFNPTTATMNVYAIDGSPVNNKQLIFTAAPLLGSPTAITEDLYLTPSSYCFVRSTTTAQALGGAQQSSSSCSVPGTSYAPPVMNAYKYDIESLNPTNFSSIFNIN